MRPPLVKFCGLRAAEHVSAAARLGAEWIGFVLVPESPRALSLTQAVALKHAVPSSLKTVALLVDPTDAQVEETLTLLAPDVIQLHGAESPERVRDISTRVNVIKAFGVADEEDLKTITPYIGRASWLLVDAKPPPKSTRTGGHGLAVKTNLFLPLAKIVPHDQPLMLAGGLTPQTVGETLQAATAAGLWTAHRPFSLDVSSGIEEPRFVKNEAKMAAFMDAVFITVGRN
jgi:phosphoribosylanthranilate isomerase